MLSGADLGRAAYETWGRHGVPVFPCNDDKRPLCKWQQASSTDEQVIVDAFARAGSKARMIGAVMGERSGLFAIDFDFYKGPEAKQFFDILLASKCLPPTRVHETLSGGLHYIYYTDTQMPRNSLPHKNVEIRGEGGYIIMPPSRGYKVQSEGAADAPHALLQRLKRAEAQFKGLSISGLTDMVLAADSFHEALTSLAAKLHARGDDPSKVMAALTEAVNSSVAANPHHERHARWKEIVRGGDGELARIHKSAFQKYNPKRGQMDVDAVSASMSNAKRNRDVTLGGFFAPIPKALGAGSFDVPAPDDASQGATDAVDTVDTDEFPFSRSYNAAMVGDQDDKTFLVHPLIMEGDVIILSAEPKAGKTLTAMTMCLHMAAGLSFGEVLTPLNKAGDRSQIPVIYFALEGQGAIRKRVRAWLEEQASAGQKLTMEDVRLYVVERPVNLTSDEAKQEIVDKMVLANAYFVRKGWGPVGMTVFDTLTKAMPGKDQNSVEDTSAVFNTVDMLREVGIDCAVMFVHHNNRQSKSPRGSSNILAEPDTILSVEKIPAIVVDGVSTDCVQLSVHMARAVDDTQKYRMAMHDVDIGLNSQNLMESAPVLRMIADYDAHLSPTDASLRANMGKAKDRFYAELWDILSNAPGMRMSFSGLARCLKDKGEAVSGFYSAHLNSNTKEGAKAAWVALTHSAKLPVSLGGISFTVEDDAVRMNLTASGALTSAF